MTPQGGTESRNADQERSLKWIFKITFIVGVIAVLVSTISSKTRDSLKIFNREPEQERVIYDITYMPEVPVDDRNRTKIAHENATILMLVRNWEIQEALISMRRLEDRFNKKYRYPWTFLNDEEFTDEFKVLTRGMASGEVEYGFIEPEVWDKPDFIDDELMQERMDDMEEREVVYGNSLSYRNMCRFNSGNFFRQPILDKYEWYWRVEPGVDFYCDINYDPFEFLRINNKKYGFVITIYEYVDTIPTLWNVSEEFFNAHPDYLAKDNALRFITDKTQLRAFDLDLESGNDYNLCHFWSNFEIGNLNFFRSKEYVEYFEHLDQSGGFYYERWGDAPVHTIGLCAFLNRSEIHHFSDFGYKHEPYHRCPKDDASYISGRCVCPTNADEDVDFVDFSCLPKWWYHAGRYFLFNFTDKPM